ncbi:TlpA family protein disulfide reductase [Candidatus Peregrinibacteria bacterium]|nr:TlpA family protein disulfide reductase [Candidatus Peregrinibacteria bacterium]
MKKIIIPVLLVIGIATVSFALSSKKNSPIANTETNTLQVEKKSSLNQIAPDFSLAKLGGGTIQLSDFRGKKPVILDFWASWCPNCRRDMPKLNGFYQTYKDRVEVIGVNLGESESDAQDFITSKNISFPIVLDSNGVAARLYQINYTNVHVLVDKNGNLVRVVPGDINESDVLSLI